MKKDLAIIGGLFLLVAALLIFGKGFTTVGLLNPERQSTSSAQPSGQSNLEEGKTTVKIKGLTVSAEVANTREKRQKGLGGRENLPISEGMLFVFDKSDEYGIWMKDMKFPIDIIWLDKDKKVVDLVSSAEIEPGKDDEELKKYTPKTESLYILEINAGLLGANNIQIGDQVEFEL